MNPFGIGGRQRSKDKRDYQVGSLGMASLYPDTFSSPVPTIYMQDKYGTCGAHAGAQLANVLFGITSSPKFLWKIIKSFDGFGLNDGTTMDAIFKALQNYGICELSLLDNSLETSIENYSDISELTAEMRNNAAQHKIGLYAFTNNPTSAQIKQAISTHKAAILLVDCGSGWYTPSWANSDVNPLHLGKYDGHHFICATGYGLTLIDGANSWSTAWGDKGMFHFLENYLPHVLEMGVASLSEKYIFTQNLSYGMTSPDVHALQRKLGITDTGTFDLNTLKALIAYQKSKGLTMWYWGWVNQATRSLLNT